MALPASVWVVGFCTAFKTLQPPRSATKIKGKLVTSGLGVEIAQKQRPNARAGRELDIAAPRVEFVCGVGAEVPPESAT